jgi:uncharacterized membrane protein (UPF0127 family)
MDIVLFADTDMKRTRGLMFHRPLDKNECAFFDFPYEGKHSFWNKNVDFPISLIFCNKKGEVVDIKKLKAQQLDPVSPINYNIKYVIEAHEDCPKLYNIKKGTRLKIEKKEVLIDGNSNKN